MQDQPSPNVVLGTAITWWRGKIIVVRQPAYLLDGRMQTFDLLHFDSLE